jgi:hypothetical protein
LADITRQTAAAHAAVEAALTALATAGMLTWWSRAGDLFRARLAEVVTSVRSVETSVDSVGSTASWLAATFPDLPLGLPPDPHLALSGRQGVHPG